MFQEDENISGFLLIGTLENLNPIYHKLKENHFDHLNVYFAEDVSMKGYYWLQSFHHQANKGSMLEKLVKRLGFSINKTLVFGDYELEITVPADFIVGATGTLQNPKEVLSNKEIARFELAKKTYDKPIIITTQKEAIIKETKPERNKTKTWKFNSTMVRDVAFAASRKYIWDAMAVDLGNFQPLAMSFYSKEGNPLWEQESTIAVANTLKTYSKHTINYPYPVAISVHAASIGMEYPMICFNFGRPNKDGVYSEAIKWRMIGVIIHEVGHNFFPIINYT